MSSILNNKLFFLLVCAWKLEIPLKKLDIILGVLVFAYSLIASIVFMLLLWFKGPVLGSLFAALIKVAQNHSEVSVKVAVKLIFFLS